MSRVPDKEPGAVERVRTPANTFFAPSGDICGLTPAAAETVKRWATAALLEAALNEVAQTGVGDRTDVRPDPG